MRSCPLSYMTVVQINLNGISSPEILSILLNFGYYEYYCGNIIHVVMWYKLEQ